MRDDDKAKIVVGLHYYVYWWVYLRCISFWVLILFYVLCVWLYKFDILLHETFMENSILLKQNFLTVYLWIYASDLDLGSWIWNL